MTTLGIVSGKGLFDAGNATAERRDEARQQPFVELGTESEDRPTRFAAGYAARSHERPDDDDV